MCWGCWLSFFTGFSLRAAWRNFERFEERGSQRSFLRPFRWKPSCDRWSSSSYYFESKNSQSSITKQLSSDFRLNSFAPQSVTNLKFRFLFTNGSLQGTWNDCIHRRMMHSKSMVASEHEWQLPLVTLRCVLDGKTRTSRKQIKSDLGIRASLAFALPLPRTPSSIQLYSCSCRALWPCTVNPLCAMLIGGRKSLGGMRAHTNSMRASSGEAGWQAKCLESF